MLYLLSLAATILSVGAVDLGVLIAEGAVVVGAGVAVTVLGVKLGKKKKAANQQADEQPEEKSEEKPEENFDEVADEQVQAVYDRISEEQKETLEKIEEEKDEEKAEETTEEVTEETTEETAEEQTEEKDEEFEKYNSLNDDAEEVRRHLEESKATVGQETPTPAGDGQSWEQVKDYNAAVMPIIVPVGDDDDDDEEGEPAGDDELKVIIDEDGNELHLSYRRSFQAKIIQSDKIVKDYYAMIVAELLSYKKIKSRTSWGAETFTFGRAAKAKLTMRGKTLALYLALNPSEQEAKYHLKDCSEKKKYADVPSLMKIKSTRAVKFAKELIAKVMADTVKLPDEPELLEIPYEKTSALVGKGLIKVIANGGKARISDELMQEIAATEDKDDRKYRLSFQAKIIRADEKVQQYYSEIKNELLSYKKVKARSSWGAETFNLGREAKAKLTVRGKTLVCYLALDPKKYEGTKYFFKDLSEKKKYAAVPMQLKIKSDRGLKYAKELIGFALDGVTKLDIAEVDYTSDYKDMGQLLKDGLVKAMPQEDD